MSSNFIPPELQETISDLYGDKPKVSGGTPDRIGPGLYKFTLPDGQQIIVDDHGNIIG